MKKNELDKITRRFILKEELLTEEKVNIGAILQNLRDMVSNIGLSTKEDQARIESIRKIIDELESVVRRMNKTIKNYRYEQNRKKR
jgi:hypothetical protein